MASPAASDEGASAAAAVCCMCGDHGLPHELFRCNLCRLRTQHRYCSDLYPRAAGPYRSCNWCLRRQPQVGAGRGDSAAGTKRRSNDSRGDEDHENERACHGCCSRSEFSADPGKPIKKPTNKKKGRGRAVQQPVVTMKKRREVMEQPAGKPRFRVKVRRYKLLAEVI